MIQQMSGRERLLAALVAGVAFIFVNFFVVEYFVKNQRRLQGDFARSTGALTAMKLQVAEKPLWQEREAWLRTNQTPVTDEIRAADELRNSINQLAARKSVQIISNTYGAPAYLPEHTSISVQVETTSTWPATIAFLHELQAPGKFLVFESANLKKDDKVETQMRCSFKIAHWYAPKTKPK